MHMAVLLHIITSKTQDQLVISLRRQPMHLQAKPLVGSSELMLLLRYLFAQYKVMQELIANCQRL